MQETFKKYADDIFAMIADVNEKEIGSHIAADNLVAWCVAWRTQAVRVTKKLLMEASRGLQNEE